MSGTRQNLASNCLGLVHWIGVFLNILLIVEPMTWSFLSCQILLLECIRRRLVVVAVGDQVSRDCCL